MTHAKAPLHRLVYLLLTALLCWPAGALADSLTVQVDRSEISINETVTLTVRYDGRQVNADPDFSGLDQFDVLSNHKSTQHSIINGAISASTEWRLTLAPRNTGQLLIPPLSLQGQHSKALTITVTEASKDPVSGREDVFLETYLDKSTVYVQEQFIVTYRLHFNQSVDSLDTGQFSIDQARVEELPRVDFQKTIGHTPYGVAEFRYAVFPDASGTIEIPAQTWTVRTTDQPGISRFGFGGGRFKLHRVRTKALTVTVNPKPDTFPAAKPWLPAQSLTISEQWSRPPEEFKVGEPITRTVTVTAEGVGPEQLPPLFDERGTNALKFYPDKPEQDKKLSARGVTGVRTESIAIVPSVAGSAVLPEVSVTWWNSAEHKVEKTVLPARTLQIAPNEAAARENPAATDAILPTPALPGQATPAPPADPSGWWPLLVLVLALSNIVTLVFWWWQRRRVTAEPVLANADSGDAAAALREVQAACKRGDADALRSVLLKWGRLHWPGQHPSLTDIGRWSQNTSLARELAKLDARLFAQSDEMPDFALVAEGIRALSHASGGRGQSAALPPLYRAS